MKSKDLRDRATDDLVELRGQLKKDLFGYRMKNFTNQLDDTSLVKRTRKDIARIEHILHERRTNEAKAEEATGGES